MLTAEVLGKALENPNDALLAVRLEREYFIYGSYSHKIKCVVHSLSLL